ncbi:MAG: hypothetical protein HZRFUVUK_001354 [Candidatus Fervidibacterota bacterium]
MKYALLVVIGFFCGMYGCIIGAGGGFILMPLLLLMHPSEEPETLVLTSLLSVFINAVFGSMAYARLRRINYSYAVALSISLVPGSILGAFLTGFVERKAFNIIFGALLLLISLRLSVQPIKGHETVKALQHTDRSHIEMRGNSLMAYLLGSLIGCIGSFAGVGGGIMFVPLLIWLFKMPPHIATATSMPVVCVNALVGAMTHVLNGVSVDAYKVVALGVGMAFGAQIGAALSEHISSSWLLRLLAIALCLAGIRVIAQAF